MSRKLLLLCALALIGITWRVAAQTNTTRATAQEISPGEQIVTQFTPGTVEELWYKIGVTAGKWYEIPHSPYALELYKGNETESWHGYVFNDSYSGFRAIQFQAEETGFYYIERWYNSAVGDRLEWSIVEVTDNRVCSNAETIQLGTTTNVPTGQRDRWYKATHESDKYYVVDEESLETSVYASCGVAALTHSGQVYRMESTADRFFKSSGLNGALAGGTLKVREVPLRANTTRETALPLTLGQAVEYSHIFGVSLYFKVNLEAGKAYEIIADNINQFYRSSASVYDPESIAIPVLNDAASESPAGESRWFTAPSTGVFYIERSRVYPSDDPTLWTMVVAEITDARVCSNAVPAAENQTITYHHKNYRSHWWKIGLEAGNTYLVDFVNAHGNSSKIGVFAECGDENPVEQGNSAFSFVATKTGVYYLQAFTPYSQFDEELSSFTVRRIANQNNLSCASALAIELGDTVTAAHSFGNNLWYKVNVEAGKAYEVDGRRRASSYSDAVKVFTACGQTKPAYSGYSNPLLYLEPEANGVYYINWIGEASTPAFAWQVNEVTDNRTCSMAEMVSVGQDITITRGAHPNNAYWYRLTMQGGEVYEIDFSNAYKSGWYSEDDMEFYGQCGPDQHSAGRITKSKYLIAPEKDSVLYLKINPVDGPNDPLVWRVNELNSTDNRLCSYATTVSLNTDIPANHSTGYVTQWYKITLTAGKIYEVDASQAGNSLFYYKGNICSGALHFDNRIPKGTKVLLDPAETSEYRILSHDEEVNSNFTWSIKETVGDNRLRAFATEVTPGTAFSVDHRESSVRWFKVNMAVGALYSINFSANYQEVNIFSNDNPDVVLKRGYASDFSFLAQAGGVYYLQFYNDNVKAEVSCTVEGITDNRSCLYPVPVAITQNVSGTGLSSDGRWFSLSLDEGGIYEFDFTNIGSNGVTGKIYSSCSDLSSLDSGKNEKLLFKAPQAGTYLVHIALEEGFGFEDAWTWSFNTAAPDNRLCEYATTVNVGDSTTIDLSNGIGRRWYKVEVEGGKFYEMGTVNSQYARMEVYPACGENRALAVLSGNKRVISPESSTTLYVKASNSNNAQWYIKEVPADGLLCYEGIEIALGQEITTAGSGVEFEITPAGYNYPIGFSNGTWYKISNLEPGIYEARLEQWQEYEEDENFGGSYEEGYYYGPFYYVNVFGSCDASTSYIGSAGHRFNRGRIRFQVNASQAYYLFLANESPSPSFTWELVKVDSEGETGIIHVSLADANDQPLAGTSGADVYIYRKQGNALTLADTPQADGHSGTFSSTSLGVGAYLVYIDKVQGHLAGWYQNAGIWEDATEVNLTKQGVRIKYTPKPAPTDISTGDITIAGTVLNAQTNQGVTVDISLFRKKSKGFSPSSEESTRKVKSSWELVARLKTDSNGSYQIENLPAGHYMIMVDLPGYASENGGFELNAQSGESYKNNNFEVDDQEKTVKKTTTGVHELNALAVKLYPNPFNGGIAVEGAQGFRLQVFSVSGACVHTQLLIQEKEEIRLDVPAGTYLFRFQKGGKTVSFVTIKQ